MCLPFLLLLPMCVCVCRISHRFLPCFCRLSTFCTCQLRLAFVFQLCERVGMGWGVGGVTTSMRIRLVSSVSFVASYVCVCVCRISRRFLTCFCRLSTFCTCQLRLAFVFQLCERVGMGWGVGGVTTSMRIRFASSVSFVASCVCVCVAFRIGFYRVFADSRLSAHASLDLHLSFSSVRGWGWGGGWEGRRRPCEYGLCLLFLCCFLCVCVCVSHFASVFIVFLLTLDFLHMPA